jgi:membrane protein
VLICAEVTAALGEREQWCECEEMVHSAESFKTQQVEGKGSDRTDSESK